MKGVSAFRGDTILVDIDGIHANRAVAKGIHFASSKC
jgi:hypothetical protein